MKFKLENRMYLIPAGFLVFILFFTVFGNKGLLRIYELRKDKAKIEKRLTEIRGENENLKREVVALQSDRRYIERIARKDLGLVRSNEVIFQFARDTK